MEASIKDVQKDLQKDIKEKETASEILSLMENNNLTISEAFSVLQTVKDTIAQSRIIRLCNQ